MEFRPARPDDVVDLVRLMHEAIDGLATRAYDPEELVLWKSRITVETMRQRIEDPQMSFLVAEKDHVVLAFGARSGQVIRFLYVRPSMSGQGLALRIMERLEDEARHAGIAALELDASRNAVPFYRRLGFSETGQQGCSAADRVLCTHMVKPIT